MLRATIPALLAATAIAADPAAAAPAGFLDFSLKANDGSDYPLSKLKGKVVLLVNTASKCGNTPQYAAMQKLHETYGAKGLVVLAVPANEFGKQEPGSDADIAQFCTSKYHVTFPLMSKIVVKGEGIHPLYEWLTTKSLKPGAITWNFAKFLIGRDGSVIDRFDPKTKPDDAKVTAAIESALAVPELK